MPQQLENIIKKFCLQKKVFFYFERFLVADSMGKCSRSDSRNTPGGKKPTSTAACSFNILMRSSSMISCLLTKEVNIY